MDENHFWAAMLYVEQNPVRARLVEQAGEWRWSSAQAHLRGEDAGLLDLVPWRARHTPESWKLYLDRGLQEASLIERIRDAIERGQPLRDEAFVKRVHEQRRAKPSAEPPEPVINLEMAAT
jgi:putative transposase